MARLARSTVIGYPHQVTQRGNYEQSVFEADADFQHYLAWLREYATRYSVEIWAYCLMRNHVHFICVPKADGVARPCFQQLHMRYAQYFHGKKGRDRSPMEGKVPLVHAGRPKRFRGGPLHREQSRPGGTRRAGRGLSLVERPSPCLGRTRSDHHGRLFSERTRSRIGGRIWLARGDDPILTRTWCNLKTGRPAGDDGICKASRRSWGDGWSLCHVEGRGRKVPMNASGVRLNR